MASHFWIGVSRFFFLSFLLFNSEDRMVFGILMDWEDADVIIVNCFFR